MKSDRRQFLFAATALLAGAILPAHAAAQLELQQPGALRIAVYANFAPYSARGKGVVMTMGKGGVGKTTLAVRLATQLARAGQRVTLTTTDPAAHVEAAARERPATLHVTRIDPVNETRRYTEEVLATAGEGLDAQGRALLEEDLRSPCTEEIAVFRAFADTVARGENEFVVIDTAPTGHTLLLLDAAEAYHREVLRKARIAFGLRASSRMDHEAGLAVRPAPADDVASDASDAARTKRCSPSSRMTSTDCPAATEPPSAVASQSAPSTHTMPSGSSAERARPICPISASRPVVGFWPWVRATNCAISTKNAAMMPVTDRIVQSESVLPDWTQVVPSVCLTGAASAISQA